MGRAQPNTRALSRGKPNPPRSAEHSPAAGGSPVASNPWSLHGRCLPSATTFWRRYSSGSAPPPTSPAPPSLASPSAVSSPTRPSCAGTALSTGRNSSASWTTTYVASNPPKRPTPPLLSPPLSPAPSTSPPTATSLVLAAQKPAGMSGTSETAVSSSSASLGARSTSSTRSRCATPWPGDACCCLPYLTTFSPPSRFRSNISWAMITSLSHPVTKRMTLHLE
ncbi:hypothetical protein BS78_08G145800 [Paspalum vaginatum]|nr:hypothetical protein BS78_08G145800 [Paspalum vaginatum]